MEFEKKVALVTGGARGIGLSIAQALVREGASVFICGRNPVTLKMALGHLHALRGENVADGAVADVRQYEECRRVVQEAARRFGRVDILVNNAGVGIFKPIDQLTVEEWDAAIQTNLSGVFYFAAKPFRSCGRVAVTSQACLESMVLPEAPRTAPPNSA